MKKINLTTLVLLVYLAVMSFIGWPANRPDASYAGYFGAIGATLVIILLLRYVQIKRWKMRRNRPKDDLADRGGEREGKEKNLP